LITPQHPAIVAKPCPARIPSLVASAKLITWDARRYRTYFPGMRLISPED
jgi:hypothetical protein